MEKDSKTGDGSLSCSDFLEKTGDGSLSCSDFYEQARDMCLPGRITPRTNCLVIRPGIHITSL